MDEITTGVAIALGERRALTACPGVAAVWYDVTMLVRAIDAALRGCVATLGDPLSTIFDATVDGDRVVVASAREVTAFGPPRRWVTVSLATNSWVSVTLPLWSDAGDLLDASYWITDYGIPIRGTFSRVATAEEETLWLQLDDDEPREPIPREVILTRPLVPQPQRFAGAYRIRLSRDPMDREVALTGVTRLQINPRGFGLLMEAVLRDESGTERGRLGVARCEVGHAGSLSCTGKYFIETSIDRGGLHQTEVGLVDEFRMTGRLRSEETLSSGGYLVGTDPPWYLYTSGQWFAERIED